MTLLRAKKKDFYPEFCLDESCFQQNLRQFSILQINSLSGKIHAFIFTSYCFCFLLYAKKRKRKSGSYLLFLTCCKGNAIYSYDPSWWICIFLFTFLRDGLLIYEEKLDTDHSPLDIRVRITIRIHGCKSCTTNHSNH